MLKILTAATLLAAASVSLAQTAQPNQTTPSVTPSQTPIVTPSQTPAVTPSQAPVINPQVDAPVVGGPAPTIGGIEARPIVGLSPCENLLAFEREKCLQAERGAATGASTAPPTGVPAAPTGVPAAPTAVPAAPTGAPGAPMSAPDAPAAGTSAPMSPAAPAGSGR